MVGGTVGDIESLPFLEAIRQLRAERGADKALFMHLTLPDVLLCRSDRPLPEGERGKIALFTNVPEAAVISVVDQDNIHRIPMWLHGEGLDAIVIERLKLNDKARAVADLSDWQQVVDAGEHPLDAVTIAVVGKYVDHQDAYKSVAEALKHGGIRQTTKVNLKWIEAQDMERDGAENYLHDVDGVLVPGGFGDRGFEGKVLASRYARETGLPYFGICYGMQAAVVDVARHLAGLTHANSTENEPDTPHPVIALMSEWRTRTGEIERRSATGDLGGTMRLGLQEQRLKPGTRTHALYAADVVSERHRHRYEFNNYYRTQLEAAGLVIAGKSMDDLLVEVVELPDHPWFIACQAHPEFLSTPRGGHPLFVGFIHAARERRKGGCLLWRLQHEPVWI